MRAYDRAISERMRAYLDAHSATVEKVLRALVDGGADVSLLHLVWSPTGGTILRSSLDSSILVRFDDDRTIDGLAVFEVGLADICARHRRPGDAC